MSDAPAPSDLRDAADWLTERHPHLRSLAERVIGRPLDYGWLGSLAGAVVDSDAHDVAWAAYRIERTPPDDDDEFAWWQMAGPDQSPAARRFQALPTPDQRLVRLVATLDRRIRWSISEIPSGDAGVATEVLTDWLAIVGAHTRRARSDTGRNPQLDK